VSREGSLDALKSRLFGDKVLEFLQEVGYPGKSIGQRMNNKEIR
jgi:hypothetical protein